MQVRHIKSKYGDYFGITVAGYPGMLQVFASNIMMLRVFLSFSLIISTKRQR